MKFYPLRLYDKNIISPRQQKLFKIDVLQSKEQRSIICFGLKTAVTTAGIRSQKECKHSTKPQLRFKIGSIFIKLQPFITPNNYNEIIMTQITKKIRVVAGIIWNKDQTKILLSQRKKEQDFSGLWEFPGGKVETDEDDGAALIRELQEELNITVTEQEKALSFQYEYPTKTIDFVIYDVFQFSGEPKGAESQMIAWVDKQTIGELQFPEANYKMLEYITKFS